MERIVYAVILAGLAGVAYAPKRRPVSNILLSVATATANLAIASQSRRRMSRSTVPTMKFRSSQEIIGWQRMGTCSPFLNRKR